MRDDDDLHKLINNVSNAIAKAIVEIEKQEREREEKGEGQEEEEEEEIDSDEPFFSLVYVISSNLQVIIDRMLKLGFYQEDIDALIKAAKLDSDLATKDVEHQLELEDMITKARKSKDYKTVVVLNDELNELKKKGKYNNHKKT